MRRKQTVVTGGAGFIGSTLSKALLAEGWSVLVIDNLSSGCKANIPRAADFLKIDLSKKGFEKKLPQHKFDVLFHLAAQSSGEISFENPWYDAESNAVGTLLLLEWCRKYGTKRHLFASSMGIYGNAKKAVNEEVYPRPISFYGIGKLAAEHYIRIFQKLGINSTILRLFNVYGPGQDMKNLRQGMVSIYLSYITNHQPILVKGSKDRFRDFIYIDDVIATFLRAVNHKNAFGETFNVGTGKKTSITELLKLIVSGSGYKNGAYPIHFRGTTPGDIFGVYADVSKIYRRLRWEPKISLKEGLALMITWLKGCKKTSS